MTMSIKTVLFLFVALSSLLERYQQFQAISCLLHPDNSGNKFI